MSKLKLQYPTQPYKINQKFGENFNGFYKQLGMDGHNGLDLYALDGDNIYAAHDGVVTQTGADGSGGLGVVIRTHDKFEYKGEEVYFKTLYWHLQTNSFKVKPGDHVKAGQVIALADNTGMSTGSHLHFGLKPQYAGEADWQWSNVEQNNGFFGAIDPEPYLPPTTTTVKYEFKRNLSAGMKGEDVAKLQELLKELGFFYYPEITGYYGDYTKVAVLSFQVQNKICTPLESVYGRYCGPKTFKKIKEIQSNVV